MAARVVFAIAVVLTSAQYAAAQSLATPVAVPEPTTGILLGLSVAVYGLHSFLRRRPAPTPRNDRHSRAFCYVHHVLPTWHRVKSWSA